LYHSQKKTPKGHAFPGNLPCITCKAGANIESFLLAGKIVQKKIYLFFSLLKQWSGNQCQAMKKLTNF